MNDKLPSYTTYIVVVRRTTIMYICGVLLKANVSHTASVCCIKTILSPYIQIY